MLEIALGCIARGWHVFPCRPKTKEPAVKGGFKAATIDEAQIRSWWTRWPDANVGIATGASGLCVLDVDTGLDAEADLHSFMREKELPETYIVRTGRRPGYGAQLYYVGAGLKSIAWQDGRYSGDIRCATGYVMAEGSVHPSGELYERLEGEPDALEAVPEYVRNVPPAIKAGLGLPNPAVHDDGGKITDHRNVTMVHLLGKARAAGYDDAALEAYAAEVNESRFEPPLEEAELDRIVANICKYAVPDTGPEVLIGGKTAGAKGPESAAPEPPPVDWRTHYHTFEEVRDAPPAEFLIEGFLQKDSITGLAAPVGQRKSLIALNVAHSLCTGAHLFGRFPVVHKPQRVLYLCPEMGLRSFADRLKAIGLMEYVCENLFIRTMSQEGHLTLDELRPEELDDSVVIIDTAIRYLQGDESSSDDMRVFAASIFRLLKKGDRPGAVSVLLLHHSPKGTKETNELTLENAMRGSGEIGAFVTSCWATRLQDPARPYQSASYIVNVKQRDFESKPFEVTSGADFKLTYVEGSTDAALKQRTAFQGNKDGKDEAALAVIKANPDLSVQKLADLLGEHGIARGREWVRRKKPEVCGTGSTAKG